MKSRADEIDARYGLEPLFEPDAPADAGEPEQFIDVTCPYCAETISARIDLSAGAQNYIEDCQVCCRPISMSLQLGDDGSLLRVSAGRQD